jgi:hypothetical protein
VEFTPKTGGELHEPVNLMLPNSCPSTGALDVNLLLAGRYRCYGLPKSGMEMEPSAASGNPGLYAISQTWPSGSVKQPAYPP